MIPHQRLGDRLVDAGAASRAQIEAAATEARDSAHRLGETLVTRYHVDEVEVWRALAAQRELPLCRAEELIAIADPTLRDLVPRRFLEAQRVLPIARSEGRVIVATPDPDAHVPGLADAVKARGIDLRLVTPLDFRRIRMALDLGNVGTAACRCGPPEVRDIAAEDGHLDAALVALFEAILLDAIAERASDVHLERYGDRVRVRLRIDGDLHDARHFQISPEQLRGLVNVIKVSGNLDIAEQRLPQGGRFTTRAGGRVFDLRIQTQPSLHGEHAIIRLLAQDTKLLTIEELGFPEDLARIYRRLIEAPSGLVLVVGPTGCGKSTTLYAGLEILARDTTRKVISVEDPIEYAIEGVQQTAVRPELGFGFAHAMRSFVREDPDVILLGEIRDGETALEALRASQTGHLVLSTLHCNDSVDAVQRLVDLGMHPNSIASELLAVFAQRLAKRVCEFCRGPATPRPEVVAELFPGGTPEGLAPLAGKGCARCGFVGSRGRIGVVEHLRAGPELRRGIARGLPLDDLRAIAIEDGLVPMRDQGLAHVAAGRITIEELRSLLPPERLAPER